MSYGFEEIRRSKVLLLCAKKISSTFSDEILELLFGRFQMRCKS